MSVALDGPARTSNSRIGAHAGALSSRRQTRALTGPRTSIPSVVFEGVVQLNCTCPPRRSVVSPDTSSGRSRYGGRGGPGLAQPAKAQIPPASPSTSKSDHRSRRSGCVFAGGIILLRLAGFDLPTRIRFISIRMNPNPPQNRRTFDGSESSVSAVNKFQPPWVRTLWQLQRFPQFRN